MADAQPNTRLRVLRLNGVAFIDRFKDPFMKTNKTLIRHPLPADAKIVGCSYFAKGGQIILIVQSSEFEEVGDEAIPEHDLRLWRKKRYYKLKSKTREQGPDVESTSTSRAIG